MIQIPSTGVPIKAWIEGVPVEAEAVAQLQNIARLPVVGPHVAVMPDVHLGKGATVGSVVPTRGAIIPAAIGVDIGCGMSAIRTNLVASDLPDSLAALRSAIEAAVPHGRTANGGPGDKGAWASYDAMPRDIADAWCRLAYLYDSMCVKHPGMRAKTTGTQLGTLGGGNHFIEVCLDESQQVWVMLHSGSRGLGNRIGSYFIELAKQDMRRAHGNLPEDEDLAYLREGTVDFDDYWAALTLAQLFASMNREMMRHQVLLALEAEMIRIGVVGEGRRVDGLQTPELATNCHHNYASREHHFGQNLIITRKGAVNASLGKLGIIPGSMGAKSHIVRGLGNAESFHSCSHGAGRAMSRNAAKKQFTVADHVAATAGVECRKDADVVDETPGAYKSIDAVMAAQTDLVEIVHTLRQVLCVKG